MSDLVRVIPAKGRLVRDPNAIKLPDEGKIVDRSVDPIYWHRLARRGDVTIEAIPEAQPEAPQPEATPAPESEV